MTLKSTFGLLFLLLSYAAFAQQEQRIRGKVVAEQSAIGISSITVMNLVTEQVVSTDAAGDFSIVAKPEDLLIFSSVNYEYKRRIIEANDFGTPIVVSLIPKATQLEEVVILRDINPEDLGLVRKGQKRYTVAERRLKQAGEFKPQSFIGMVAGLSIPIDPIMNAISGRTKMLKKYVKSERSELLFEKLGALYEGAYYVEKHSVPQDYVDGFRYYLIEDATFVALLESGMKVKMDFQMISLAQKFNELIALESK
ncbi:MAG: hypothetical protein EOP06_12150 [Proteobacteria bacterium]|nr:MAG: hypothetical protein EOP06_12150 [Pseudomonadota bacterium]